jgi:hypothetical protein
MCEPLFAATTRKIRKRRPCQGRPAIVTRQISAQQTVYQATKKKSEFLALLFTLSIDI